MHVQEHPIRRVNEATIRPLLPAPNRVPAELRSQAGGSSQFTGGSLGTLWSLLRQMSGLMVALRTAVGIGVLATVLTAAVALGGVVPVLLVCVF